VSKITDPIADLLTRIRNAVRASHDQVDCPASGVKSEICRILKEEQFIEDYELIPGEHQATLRVRLKYGHRREPVIKQIRRISKPGLRVYAPATRLPRVLNGMGIAILSTSRGLLADRDARKQHVGGEVICEVW
jgi:small subunit ribosomal protein S8